METRRLVKGGHTRKTAAFVRACAAYCFITIPSVDNILLRLNLYLLSGRVAVANGALSQGGCFAAVDPHYLILHITLCSESGCTHSCLVIYSQRTLEGGVCVIMCLSIHFSGDAFFKAAINSVKDVPQFMGMWECEVVLPIHSSFSHSHRDRPQEAVHGACHGGVL